MIDIDKLSDFISKPDSLNKSSLHDINELVEKFPYFQTAHLLLSKNLNNIKDNKFHKQIKLSSTYATDRKILYRLFSITSIFKSEDELIDEKGTAEKPQAESKDKEQTKTETKPVEDKKEKPEIKTPEKKVEKTTTQPETKPGTKEALKNKLIIKRTRKDENGVKPDKTQEQPPKTEKTEEKQIISSEKKQEKPAQNNIHEPIKLTSDTSQKKQDNSKEEEWKRRLRERVEKSRMEAKQMAAEILKKNKEEEAPEKTSREIRKEAKKKLDIHNAQKPVTIENKEEKEQKVEETKKEIEKPKIEATKKPEIKETTKEQPSAESKSKEWKKDLVSKIDHIKEEEKKEDEKNKEQKETTEKSKSHDWKDKLKVKFEDPESKISSSKTVENDSSTKKPEKEKDEVKPEKAAIANSVFDRIQKLKEKQKHGDDKTSTPKTEHKISEPQDKENENKDKNDITSKVYDKIANYKKKKEQEQPHPETEHKTEPETKQAPVTEQKPEENLKEHKEAKKKQDNLIDDFIKKEPNIIRRQKNMKKEPTKSENEDISKQSVKEHDDILTESLAIIYADQKLYKKAIEIYEKLILKNPEKKSYFASQIKKLEALNNKN